MIEVDGINQSRSKDERYKEFEEYQEREKIKMKRVYKGVIVALIILIILAIILMKYFKKLIREKDLVNYYILEEIVNNGESMEYHKYLLGHRLVNLDVLLDSNTQYLTELIEKKANYNFLLKEIKERTSFNNPKLHICYSSETLSDDFETFLQKCHYKNLLFIVKSSQKQIFGGFTTQALVEDEVVYDYVKDEKAFLFSLTKNKVYNVKEGSEKAFKFVKNDFFSFGDEDLYIPNHFMQGNPGRANFPKEYDLPGFTGEKGYLNITEEWSFDVTCLEVFGVVNKE